MIQPCLLIERVKKCSNKRLKSVGARSANLCSEPCQRYRTNNDSVPASEAMEKFSVEKVSSQANESCGLRCHGPDPADVA